MSPQTPVGTDSSGKPPARYPSCTIWRHRAALPPTIPRRNAYEPLPHRPGPPARAVSARGADRSPAWSCVGLAARVRPSCQRPAQRAPGQLPTERPQCPARQLAAQFSARAVAAQPVTARELAAARLAADLFAALVVAARVAPPHDVTASQLPADVDAAQSHDTAIVYATDPDQLEPARDQSHADAEHPDLSGQPRQQLARHESPQR